MHRINKKFKEFEETCVSKIVHEKEMNKLKHEHNEEIGQIKKESLEACEKCKKEFEEYKKATKAKLEKADKDALRLEKMEKWQFEALRHVHEMLKGRAPPCVYFLWIREKWMLFQLELLVFHHKFFEHKVKFFMNVFSNKKTLISSENLLCEFYLYNYMLPKNTKVNPNLLVGDVYLRALCLVFTNELEMYEKRIAFEKMKINEPLL